MASTSTLHPALARPLLVAGVEYRILILEGTLVAVLLIGIGLHVATVTASLLVAFVLHPLLARISKHDPQALAAYFRAVRYQSFYRRAPHPAAAVTTYRPFDSGL